MGEVVNVLVAFAVIVFLFRWVTSSSETTEGRSAADTLGFRPKNVTQDMLDRISQMFPDIPVDNIRYDLLRTGSVELTTNKILERGVLEAPPQAYYTVYPREPTAPIPGRPTTGASGSGASSALPRKPKESLISRYKLEERVKNEETIPDDQVGGKAAWEDSPEKREASLKERKAQMILAARQRFLAQQQQKAEAQKAQASS